MSKSTTLTEWQKAIKRRDRAQTAFDKAVQDIEIASNNHRKKHPLSERMKAHIYAAFVAGEPLCCANGYKVLTALGLDEYWTEYLNDWAYNCMGCADEWKPGGTFFDRGATKLREKLGYARYAKGNKP